VIYKKLEKLIMEEGVPLDDLEARMKAKFLLS